MSRALRSITRPSVLVAALALAASAACDNAGADRALGIAATGVVHGAVYFDLNGSLTSDAGDVPFAGARVRLLAPVSRDTLLRAVTGADGSFSFGAVPVGNYVFVLDSMSAGDSARVTGVDSTAITVVPGDSVEVGGSIGYPRLSTDEVRALPIGTRVFVTGVALHARETFSDTLLHVVDTSGAIRAMRVRPPASPLAAGDSVLMRGRVAVRFGQPVLDDVSVFVLGPTFIPTISTITTAVAAAASAGALDAALVRLVNVPVTDTSTVEGDLRMTVNDGSGALVVVLDRAADTGFRPPLPAGLYQPGRRFDLLGILVPTGTGTWRLRPRSALDLTLR